MAQVIGRLREIVPEEAYVAAGRAVIRDCLAVRQGERVLIIYEVGFEDLGAALTMAVDEVEGEVDAIAIGDPVPPMVVERVQERLESCEASVLVASFTFPREVRTPIVENTTRRRHVHMLGIDDSVIRQSLRADYVAVNRLGEDLIRILDGGREIRIESVQGTDLRARRDPKCRWHNQGGLQHTPGWTNLPAGEVVTCPSTVDGRFVPDGGLWLTDGTLIDRSVARRLTLTFEAGVLVGVEGPESPRAVLEAHVDSRREGRRVGQLSFGTNIGVLAPIGNPAQDAKLPGFHLVLGYSAPDVTGASWNGEAMVTALQRQESVWVDKREVIRRGRYVRTLRHDER